MKMKEGEAVNESVGGRACDRTSNGANNGGQRWGKEGEGIRRFEADRLKATGARRDADEDGRNTRALRGIVTQTWEC